MKQQLESRKGFTIIEVVLVLAIAGLIFLMVFIALPALQRSQRDTQRNQDVSRLSTAINNFKANNRGNVPGKAKAGDNADTVVSGRYEKGTSNNAGTWDYFYDNYLLVGSAGQTDTFADPDGEAYSLAVRGCTKGTNDLCTNQRNTKTFDEQSAGFSDEDPANHAILILYHATCNGEEAVYSSGSRNLALLYKREGGGTICIAI